MRKFLLGFISICFLTAFATVYISAQPGGATGTNTYQALLEDYADIEWNHDLDYTALHQAVWDQTQLSMGGSETDLIPFSQWIAGDATNDLGTYKHDYLSQLADMKNILGESSFDDYERNKKKQIEEEIRTDVVDFLTEWLENN
ncbi:hypothetical protein DX933_12565 [Ornithinibacillus gellani]|uniref:hypothetical protein n=1 Tax=Ornithinibacillus gellani TaxID=2293253 RepID=UPI000F48E7A1|nr:hypothetical protein [Ornithinibacillus gellani]TQS74153.1 hypothetical protein DX933_12565 [Ornithinibacillus gellani]